jgi:hypothetical protein
VFALVGIGLLSPKFLFFFLSFFFFFEYCWAVYLTPSNKLHLKRAIAIPIDELKGGGVDSSPHIYLLFPIRPKTENGLYNATK